MADENPFEQKYGALLDAQIKTDSSFAPSSTGSSDSSVNPFEAKYGKLLDAQKPSAEQQAQTEKDQAYESKVAQATPAMKKFAEEQGITGALSLGKSQLGETLGVNALARGLAAGVGAGGQGSFSERYQNLKAQDEALRRETEKQHPIATGIGEFAGYSALPAGEIAGPVESVLAKYVPNAVAGVAGAGAEAGAFGGLSAAAEQAYGTKSEREKPSILGSTAEGAVLGAGLSGALKGAGYGIEKLPQQFKDVVSSLGDRDGAVFKKMSDAYKSAEAAGETTVPFSDFITSLQNGERPSLAALGDGPVWNNFLNKTFGNHPEAAKTFVDTISDRLQKQQEEYGDFMKRMANTAHLNADTLRNDAQTTAKTLNDNAYQRLWQNGNGAGTWSSEWNNFLKNPDFVQAIKDTGDTLQQVKPGFKNPFELMGDQSLGNLRIDSDILNKLAGKGIVDVSDVAGMDKKRLSQILAEKPVIEEGTPAAMAYRQNLDATRLAQRQADVVLDAVNKNPIKMTMTDPQAVDMRYLDILQRKLGERADQYFGPTTSNQEFGRALKDMQNKITGDLKNPKSKVFNQDFYDAHEAYKDFRGANNSFDYGLNIFNSNPVKKGEMINAVQTMSPEEKDHFVRGVMSKFHSDLQNTSEGNVSKIIQKFDRDLEKPHIRDVLQQAMGQNQFDNFVRHTKSLSLLNKAKDIATSHLKDKPESLWTPLNVMLVAFQDYRLIPKILADVGYRYLDNSYANKLAQKLASPDINEFMQAYNSVKNNKNVLMAIKDGLNKFANSASVMQGGVKHFHNGGYVQPKHYEDGGQVNAPQPHDDPRFKDWFGNSVTHTQGVPHTYYTGTSKDVDFNKFNVGRHGAWFTRDPEEASGYAMQNDSQGYRAEGHKFIPTNTASRVIPAHLKIENPYTGDLPQEYHRDNYKRAQSEFFDALRAKGHDGWIPESSKGNLAVVLKHPNQIKSTFNRSWNAQNPRIDKATGGGVVDGWHKHHINEAQHFQGGGDVEMADPQNTVKAYKLFRTNPRFPGQLFPLFVNANDPVPMNKWVAAKAGDPGKNPEKVKSKIGDLAYRPGWHSGDLPIATHIGGKSDPSLKAPDYRPDNHVWAEVEHPADVDWQSLANERAKRTKAGKIIPQTAHITDQVPHGGFYRYKTNPNMQGNWMISGGMKVNRTLSDDEVKAINQAAGVSDLPRFSELQKADGGVVSRAIPVIKQLTQPIMPKTHYNHGGIVIQSHNK